MAIKTPQVNPAGFFLFGGNPFLPIGSIPLQTPKPPCFERNHYPAASTCFVCRRLPWICNVPDDGPKCCGSAAWRKHFRKALSGHSWISPEPCSLGRMFITRSDPALILFLVGVALPLFNGQPREQERIGFDDVGAHDPTVADPDIAGYFPALDAFGANQFYI